MQEAYRDLAASFHDPQEGVQQSRKRFTVSILAVAGKQGYKALHCILLPEAGLHAYQILP